MQREPGPGHDPLHSPRARRCRPIAGLPSPPRLRLRTTMRLRCRSVPPRINRPRARRPQSCVCLLASGHVPGDPPPGDEQHRDGRPKPVSPSVVRRELTIPRRATLPDAAPERLQVSHPLCVRPTLSRRRTTRLAASSAAQQFAAPPAITRLVLAGRPRTRDALTPSNAPLRNGRWALGARAAPVIRRPGTPLLDPCGWRE